jgi:hypothetical protein
MKEGDRFAVHEEGVAAPMECSMSKGPMTNVVSRMTKDVHTIEHARHEVEPALIARQTNVERALRVEPMGKPREKALGVDIVAHCHEAGIIDPGPRPYLEEGEA